MPEPSAERHTGIVRRGSLRPPPRPSSDVRAGWMALIAVLVLGAGLGGWLLGGAGGGGGQPSRGDKTAGAGGAVGATATATPEVTDRPTVGLTASPTPRIEPTPRPTIEPTPRPTSEPTPQLAALVIDFPADGEIVHSGNINIIGTAPPGATVTRDIPLWFDDHTIAGDDGLWMLPVELAEGENRLALRLGDDPTTAQVLLVTYQPAP